jgi:hypothetical protein
VEEPGISSNKDIEENKSEKNNAFKPELLDNSLLENKPA